MGCHQFSERRDEQIPLKFFTAIKPGRSHSGQLDALSVMRLSMKINRIDDRDKSRALAIYRDCAQWLHDKGVEQWGHYLTEEAQPLVDRRFREGEVYMATVDGQDAAVIVLQWEDGFWGERGKDPNAGFLHSIAVRRKFSGKGLGRELISWAMGIARERGKSVIRLDCIKANPKLLRYYGDLSFEEAGVVNWKGTEIQLLERRL